MASAGYLPFQAFARDIRSAHARHELRTDWSMSVLYRRPGVVLAWLAHRAWLTPVAVTGIGFLVALAMPVLAWLPPMAWAVWGVALAGAVFQVLDCADGTLARTTGQRSAAGADLDTFVGLGQYILLYIAIGMLADRQFDTGWAWTALGAAAAAARLLARVIRDQVALRRTGAAHASGPPSLLAIPSVVLGGISGLLPFLALTGDLLGWAVGFLLVYSLLDIGEGLMPLASSAYTRPEQAE